MAGPELVAVPPPPPVPVEVALGTSDGLALGDGVSDGDAVVALGSGVAESLGSELTTRNVSLAGGE